MSRYSPESLIPEAELLFALLVARLGRTKARSVWADIAKAKRGTGKAASKDYNQILEAMWKKAKERPGASQGQLIREAASDMFGRLGPRADQSRERQLQRRWPPYRRVREERDAERRLALAEALVRPATPLAAALFDMLPPPSEKDGN